MLEASPLLPIAPKGDCVLFSGVPASFNFRANFGFDTLSGKGKYKEQLTKKAINLKCKNIQRCNF